MFGRAPTIGVFDSGVGGLTVLRELRRQLPQARYIYLGDTARLPYGSKSRATIARYAVESALFLVRQGAEYLVIACNTASALALDDIRAAVSVPVLGVIETGAAAARARSLSGSVLVIATTATVASHAYKSACRALGLHAFEKACPLLVPLVEEGWTLHPVTREVLRIYLAEALSEALAESAASAERSEAADARKKDPAGLQALRRIPEADQPAVPGTPDTLVLGCTHYPLLRAEIQALSTPRMAVIDSAEVTASFVVDAMDSLGFKVLDADPARPSIDFYATDGVDRFRALGSRFLGEPINAVTLVDLGG